METGMAAGKEGNETEVDQAGGGPRAGQENVDEEVGEDEEKQADRRGRQMRYHEGGDESSIRSEDAHAVAFQIGVVTTSQHRLPSMRNQG